LPSDRLTGSDKRALILWVIAGIVGVIFAHHYFFRAFPEASVNFHVSRGESLRQAQRFLAGMHEDVSGYRTAVAFDLDDEAKTYLERELGLQQANQMMSSQLDIWYWDVRFFRPQQEEEYHVRISPGGKVVGYEHKIPEARAGPSIDRQQAQAAAQSFLIGTLGIDLNNWDFLAEESNSNKKPNRMDWSFTWEKHGFRAKDAPYRLGVTLQGDRIGDANEYLQIPEAWKRSFARLRSGNDTLALVFIVPYVILLGAALWLGIKLTQRGQTSWRGAIVLGILVAALLFLQNLNNWPLWGSTYDTNQSYGSFIVLRIGSAILVSILTALTITLVLPAAEPLYRVSQPTRLQLSRIFTARGLRSKEFFSAAVVGLSLAAVHIGYVVAFYVIASRLGAWAPQELNYEESVNTLFPWISGAAIGLLASTNEEFTFRLFAIPFFERVTRSRWIAVIVPAFLWSFLHSNYPQEPPYIRGIEIGLFGIIAGLVMLRWGILSTLIWHYTVDASLVGLFLIRSNNLYFKVSGAVVAAAAVAPLLFSGVSYLTRGRFEADEDLLNSAAPTPQIRLIEEPAPAATVVATNRYTALAPGMLTFLAVCVLASGLILWRLKPDSIGDYLKLSVHPKTVHTLADQVMRQRGLDPNSYRSATIFANVTDPLVNEFLRQRIGVARLNEIYATQVPGAIWQVRYFRDGQPEEYSVKLKPDGALFAVNHKLAEDAPGASLTKDEAVARAEKYLRDEKKLDLSQWTLVESNSDKRPHRIDHVLTWQQNAPLDSAQEAADSKAPDLGGHAFARVKVVVLGDQVSDYRQSYYPESRDTDATYGTYIKIPDEWRRHQQELTPMRTIFNYVLPLLVLGGGAITILIIFLKNLRSETARSIPWKRLSRWALWAFAAFYVSFFLGDRIAAALNAYDTAVPIKTIYGVLGISALLGGPFNLGLVAVTFAVAWYFAKRAFDGREDLPAWSGMPAPYYRDAFFIGLGGAAAILALRTLILTASQHLHTAHRSVDASFGANFDAVSPAGAIIAGMVNHSLLLTAILAVIACFVAGFLRAPWQRALIFLLAALAITGSNWGTPTDLAKQWVAQLILLGAIAFGVSRIMRFNILGCFLAIALLTLIEQAADLLGQPDHFYRLNGYAVVAAMLALLLWPLAAWRKSPPAPIL
jgi:hypothetical protein